MMSSLTEAPHYYKYYTTPSGIPSLSLVGYLLGELPLFSLVLLYGNILVGYPLVQMTNPQ